MRKTLASAIFEKLLIQVNQIGKITLFWAVMLVLIITSWLLRGSCMVLPLRKSFFDRYL